MFYKLLWLFIIICAEAFALYCIKEYSISNNILYFILSTIMYAILPFIIYKLLKLGDGIAIINIAWNILSTLYGLFIGVILFGEYITFQQKIGSMLGLISTLIILFPTDI